MDNLTKEEIANIKNNVKKDDQFVLKFSHSLEMGKHLKDCMIVDHVDEEGNIHGVWQSNGDDVMIVPLQDIYEKIN